MTRDVTGPKSLNTMVPIIPEKMPTQQTRNLEFISVPEPNDDIGHPKLFMVGKASSTFVSISLAASV
jgi:hypothetical protein